MGQQKRQRTAQRHMTELDHKALGIADEAIQEHNFHKLLEKGVIVEERFCVCNYDLGLGPNLLCPVHGEKNAERTNQCQKTQQ